MFCHEARPSPAIASRWKGRKPGGDCGAPGTASWNVMFSPCGGCICDGRFRHDAALSDGRSGYSIRFPGFGLRHVSLLSTHLRSVLPAAGFPKRRDPNSRVSCAGACARGRAFAPARFARLIARARPCARARRRAHLARWPNRGLFRAGAHGETKRLRERRFRRPVSYSREFLKNQVNKINFPENMNIM